MARTIWISGIFALAVLKFVALLYAHPDYLLGHTLADDAFYYLKIAQNAWEGDFPTFDGIHDTNGFHYLYQGLLIPLTPLWEGDLQSVYMWVISLNAFFFLFGCFFLWRVLVPVLPLAWVIPLIAFVTLGTLSGKIVSTGMESSLAFAVGMCFLWAYTVRQAPSWVLGLLLGLLVWARLDIGVLFGCAFLLVQGVGEKHLRRSYAQVGVTVGVASAVILPILLFNLVTFGEVGTISSATKVWVTQAYYLQDNVGINWERFASQLQRSVVGYSLFLGGNTIGSLISLPYALIEGKLAKASEMHEVVQTVWVQRWLWLLIVATLTALALLVRRWIPGRAERVYQFSPSLFVFLVLVPLVHLSVIALVISYHGGTWYWLFMAPAIGLAAFWTLAWSRSLQTVVQVGLLVLAIAGWCQIPLRLEVIGALRPGYSEVSWYTGPVEVAAVITKRLDTRTARIGSFNAGLLGYLSPAPVVNLDGLVNNWELLEARQQGKMREYLIQKKITHIADFGPWDKYLEELGLRKDEVKLLFQSKKTTGYLLELNI